MFATLIVRLPDPLRRAGAYLKAFALLEDVATRDRGSSDGLDSDPEACVSRPPAEQARERRHGDAPGGPQGAARAGRGSAAHERRQRAAHECRDSAAHEEGRHNAAHERGYSGSPAPSQRYRPPPRTHVDRLAPRRGGAVAAGLQTCCQPPAPGRDTPAQPTRARCSGRGRTAAGH
jgi:hypothetical protein